MLVPLPDLDDRRWTDLVDESRALIPVIAPEWTDHNVSDPGVTLVELFAWLTEIDIFRVNQVPAAARERFLRLVGVAPRPPAAARTVLAFAFAGGLSAASLPAGMELETLDPAGGTEPVQPGVPGSVVRPRTIRFRTLAPLTVVEGGLAAAYAVEGTHVRDLMPALSRGGTVSPFGDDPGEGAALYIGLTRAVPVDATATLGVVLDGPGTDVAARERLLAEQEPDPACLPVPVSCDCDNGPRRPPRPAITPDAAPPAHHSVVLAWEVLGPGGDWIGLAPVGGVDDDTRSLTLDGRVDVRVPLPMVAGAGDGMDATRFYVRCRIVAGRYDAAPRIRAIALNAVAAEQAATPRLAAARRPMTAAGDAPDADRLGVGNGRPWQTFATAEQTVVAAGFDLVIRDGDRVRRWERRADLDASTRGDPHYLLDATTGTVMFGDGEHGRTVPDGAVVVAEYLVTRAEKGDLEAGRAFTIVDGPHNAGALPPGLLAGSLAGATNVVAAASGAAAETLAHAEGRALELVERVDRAVTLADIERLVLETAGTRVARAGAIAGLHPCFPCVEAPGMVTVVVLPHLPAGRPEPTAGLLRAVRAFLSRRRLIGMRFEVVGPAYTEVAVRTTVAAAAGIAPGAVRDRVASAVRRFLDPLGGGPDGTGWPFGRDVYRTEVLDAITHVDGVARVESLELVAAGCGVCSNVCIARTGLVASGAHEITVR